MDRVDRAIIGHLQDDARMAYTEIARLTGVSESTVRNRVARLLEEEGLRLRGTVDPLLAGFHSPAFLQVSVRPGHLEGVAAELAAIPEVSYLVAVTGDADLLVELMCHDSDHLLALISDHIHQIEGITHTSTMMILRIYKELMPRLGDQPERHLLDGAHPGPG